MGDGVSGRQRRALGGPALGSLSARPRVRRYRRSTHRGPAVGFDGVFERTMLRDCSDGRRERLMLLTVRPYYPSLHHQRNRRVYGSFSDLNPVHAYCERRENVSGEPCGDRWKDLHHRLLIPLSYSFFPDHHLDSHSTHYGTTTVEQFVTKTYIYWDVFTEYPFRDDVATTSRPRNAS